jgi:multiple sugar transport system permease protein
VQTRWKQSSSRLLAIHKEEDLVTTVHAAKAVPSPSKISEEADGATALVWNSRQDRQRFQWGSLVLLAPAMLLLAMFFLVPALYSFFLGFTNQRLIGPQSINWQFTGAENLQRMAADGTFTVSLSLTILFVVGSVVGTVLIGLWLAVLLQAASSLLRVIVGGIAIIAWMMPPITAGLTWYASSTAHGTFSSILGVPSVDFLNSQPLLVVTLANIWSQTGFAMLVLGAALRNVPGEVLEAADMEGASRWQRFRSVTLPLLMPTIVTLVLLVTLLSLANFALIYIMTQGGPGNATDILPLYSYQQGFTFYNVGYGALIGNVMVLLCGVLGFLYARPPRSKRRRGV